MTEETPLPEGLCLVEDPSYPGLYLFHTPNALIEDPEHPGFYQIGS